MTDQAPTHDISVTLINATIDFQLFSSTGRSLKTALMKRAVGGRITSDKAGHAKSVKALNDVSLKLEPGVRLGLVGRNGAGKTTFLRALAGIYEPTGGRIIIKGSTAAMTDLTMGMDPEATGRENIFLRGVFLGLTFAEARGIVPEIEEFTELGEFLDLPIRTYSSGMLLRLAFAVSTCIRPDILIMDEVIGVGDHAFYSKAEARLNRMIESSRIFIVASHDNSIIRRFCNRVLVMRTGNIVFDGPVEEALAFHEAHLND